MPDNPWDSFLRGPRRQPKGSQQDENSDFAFEDTPDGPRAKHEVCQWCGTVTRGPHTGKVLDYHHADPQDNPDAMDDERIYSGREARALGIKHNIDGHICPACRARVRADQDAWRAQVDERKREAARRELEQRRQQPPPETGEPS